MAEDDDGGLFGIDLDSSGEESESKAQDKVPRDFQSEDDFLLIKDTYMAKIELGEIWKTVKAPIDNPTKQESQTILHAIEELYFFRRYAEALQVVRDVLRGDLGEDFRKLVKKYEARCEGRLEKS